MTAIAGWVWLLVGFLLALVELSSGTLMFLLFAGAAVAAAVVAFLGAGIGFQAAVFLCGVVAALVAAPSLVKRVNRLTANSERFGADALIDQLGLVTVDIDPLDGSGMVKVGGELWRARAATRIAAGRQVRIAEVSGAKLVVYAIDDSLDEGQAARLSADPDLIEPERRVEPGQQARE